MKPLFWVGIVLLVIGVASLVIPIPRTQRDGISAGGMSMSVETKHSERVSPVISAVLILAGAGMLIAGRSSARG
jgi:hypothetical protein